VTCVEETGSPSAEGWLFRKPLARDTSARTRTERKPLSVPQRLMMTLLLGVLIAYPVIGYFGGPVWAVASCGALLSLVLLRDVPNQRPLNAVVEGVSWETLVFLLAVLVISMGLFEVGLVDRLQWLYEGGDVGIVGATSAVGSAILNTPPRSHLNMLALESAGSTDVNVLAALVGGDLGPRLLPMGSLAGLLWLEMLRRQGVGINLLTFMKIGALVTIPAIIASLAILAAY
jgi:arsenical pump membrane protein